MPETTGRPPFRADHVGSLLRPPEVLRARADFAAGRIGADELRSIEDAAIREVVRRQQEAGLRSATDGEFRRESWHMDFIYQLGGTTAAAARRSTSRYTPTWTSSGPTWRRPTPMRSGGCTTSAAATCSPTTQAWRT
jgi:methionine synthase II (cobalamin-independent)